MRQLNETRAHPRKALRPMSIAYMRPSSAISGQCTFRRLSNGTASHELMQDEAHSTIMVKS